MILLSIYVSPKFLQKKKEACKITLLSVGLRVPP
jgi:hypothetical protein